MPSIVIDTNVLLVANGIAPQMSDQCRLVCLERLAKAMASESVVIDRQYLIIGEYQHKLNPNRRPPGPGDAFLRHLLQNMNSADCVAPIDLTPTNQEKTDFAEFPDNDELRAAFDPADRKFVAASNAHPDKPPIVQSADSKWIGWKCALSSHAINLEILCGDELEVIRARKTK